MVDFVKITIPGKYKYQLENNVLLDFIVKVSEKTGELKNLKVAEYNNIKFLVYDSGYIELHGSLHKFYNGGKHNYNDFTYQDMWKSINALNEMFGFKLEEMKVINIEFGVNVKPPLKTSLILNNCLLAGHVKVKDISLNALSYNYKQAKKQRLIIKIYDKEKQFKNDYDLTDFIIRFELKYRKMIELNNINVFCLKDLKSNQVLDSIKVLLLKYWNSVLLYDKSIRKEELSVNVRDKKLHQWSNVNYWLELNSKQRYKQKKIYNEIVNNHSDKIHQRMHELISTKWSELIQER